MVNLFFLKLCWKNIWRNKRRTLLTVNAIGVGVMALVGLHNYYDNFHEQLIENVVSYHSGHLLITRPGYDTNKPPSLYIKNPAAIERWLHYRPEIKTFSPHILGQGMLSSPRGSASVWIKGIDPKRERRASKVASRITHGRFLEGGKGKPMVIGKQLAKMLKVKLGSKVVVMTQAVDGSIGNDLFYITGIFDTQSDLDSTEAMVREEDARALLGLPKHAVHQISVILKQDTTLEQVQRDFTAEFGGPGIQMLGWREVQKHITAMIELNKAVNRILMGVILIIAALGIINSILMSILERTREFGVMLAVGTTREEVIKMVVTETLLLIFVGLFFGNSLGILLTLYFGKFGFDLNWLTSKRLIINGALFDTVSYPTVRFSNSLLITGLILAVSFIIAFVPARQISKLRAVKALRAN